MTLIASVNINGLAAGTYNATIIISAPDAANSPVADPVMLTITVASGAEMITNGACEGTSNPWVSSGSGASFTANGNYPHGGRGYLYLGNINNASGSWHQQITISSGATPSLTFWLNVSSYETGSNVYDRCFVEVRRAHRARCWPHWPPSPTSTRAQRALTCYAAVTAWRASPGRPCA